MSLANGGYGAVFFYSVAIAVGVLLVSAAVMWLGNVRRPASA